MASHTRNACEQCGRCRFFIGRPSALEAAIPGLNILSSAYGSVRGTTGLCSRHDSFTTEMTAACSDFAAPAPQKTV